MLTALRTAVPHLARLARRGLKRAPALATLLGAGAALLVWTAAQAAISYVAAREAYDPDPTTSLTIARPTGLAAGDVMVAAIAQPENNTISTPSGWTRVVSNQLNSGSVPNLAVFVRVASVGDTSTASFTFTTVGDESMAGGIAAFRGVDNTSPVAASAITNHGSTTSSAAPSVTPGVSNAMLVSVWATHDDGGDEPVVTVPGSMTRVVGSTMMGNNTAETRLTMAHEQLTAATATGTRTASFADSYPASTATLALRPAGSTVSGTVFEDVNYGGGAGRTLAASSGVGLNGATVELYNGSGVYVSSTTTAGGGAYSFAGLAAATYHVRVVNASVVSQRSGSTGALRGVMTYRTTASSGSAVAVTNFVGGTNPALVDPGAGSSGATFNTGTGVFSAVLSGTAQSYSVVTVGSANIGSIDFGFNFDTVVNTNDSGPGSLRQAITNANTLGSDASLAQSGRTAGMETLLFMVSNGTSAAGLRSSLNYFIGGVATITPTSALPTVSTTLALDGRTQPGWSSTPVIDLNGASAGSGVSGLTLQDVTGASVRSLVVRNFNGNGININNGNGNTLAGNYLGTNAAGTAAAPNGAVGVNISASSSNLVGGTSASDRNLVSGNGNVGIVITGTAAGNLIRGNYIGTNAAGTAAVRNESLGLYINSSGNTVGGTAAGAGNLISGNRFNGLALDTGASGSTVQGNTIGLNAAGTAAVANGNVGVSMASAGSTIGGASAGAGNVISGNGSEGVSVTGAGNTISGNTIGLNAAGTAAVANSFGVVINNVAGNTVGGTTALARNTISGNTFDAVMITGSGASGTVVRGNYLGSNPAGSAALGNGRNGVYVTSSASGTNIGGTAAGAGNLISGNGSNGLQLDSGSQLVQGNLIGTNAAGTAALANGSHGIYVGGGTSHAIGGSSAAARNVISGNAGGGVFIFGGGSHTLQGNYIGTSANGASALGNAGYYGVELYGTGSNQIGGTAAGAGNVISGQSGSGKGGIYVASNSNTVQGNKIGSNAAGTAGLPNAGPGIGIFVSSVVNNTIGGSAAGAANLLAYNVGNGVNITAASATGNLVSRNSIHSNTDIGIDIAGGGRTANNGTKNNALGNAEMDTPVITSASLSGSTLTVAGHVGSAAGQATFASASIEVFKALADSSGFGQGQTYLGSLTANASGNFSGTISVSGVSSTDSVTATATDGSNSTSEFSANAALGYTVSGTVFEDLNYGGGAGRTRAASGGVGLAGARVELYNNSGSFVSATTTAAGGGYSFANVGTGAYTVRVVNASVVSSRSGASVSQIGVQTFRTEAPSGTAVAVTDHVGGLDPASADAAAGAGGTVLWTLCAAENATCTFSGTRTVRYGAYNGTHSRWVTRVLNGGTSCSNGVFGDPFSGASKSCFLLNASYQSVTNVAVGSVAIAGLDFGFNFDTVVNTNDASQGSLRQAITNANALGGDASLAQSGRTAAIENLVFMISNGSAAAGLRSTNNYFSTSAGAYNVATIAPASALPAVSEALVIDAQTQPGWTLNPIIELNGASAGSNGGLRFNVAGNAVRGLVINRFTGNGITLVAGGNTVAGNWIGTNAAGTVASANTVWGVEANANGNTLGGSTVAARNVISGNGDLGIYVRSGSGNTIQGNYIGTNAAGTAAVANASHGVMVHSLTSSHVIGGSSAGQGNLISGNVGAGIRLRSGSGSNLIRGNTIGLNAAGSAAVPNALGIQIDAAGNNNRIGGTLAGEGNVIAGNIGVGVAIWGSPASQGNAIQRNSVYSNGGIGIDLGVDTGSGGNGITTNDGAKSAGQPNLLMDAPVFASARARGSALTVTGHIGTAAGQSVFASSRVEVFVSDSGSTHGAGRTYLGALTADASGNFSGTVTMPISALRAGSVLTGTATDTANNTSEFGANFSGLVVDWLINHNGDGVDANPGDGLCETSTPGQCTLRAAIMEANAWAGADLAAFDLPSCPGAGCIITPASVLPTITGQLTLDGQTQPGWTSAPLVDLRGESAGAGSNGINISASSSIVRGLAVGGFLQSGIWINANGVTLEGNHVGIQPDGATARANSSNNSATGGVYVAGGTGIVIGGSTAAKRNVLSGNGGAGVWLNAGTATVIGNYIGTNAAGTAGVGNGRWGVAFVGGTGHRVGGAAAGEGNVVSGNVGSARGGIIVNGTGQIIQGNTIGLNAARTAAIPNGDGGSSLSSGIDLRSGTGHLIGGTNAGEGNVISGNQGYGVRVTSQTSRVLGNSVYNNLWLGIDLNADGVTANNGTQSGAQPNNDTDHPLITSAGYDPGTRALTVTGYVGTGTGQAIFAGARVELFTSDGDATGYGEGRDFVGTLTADANGRFSGTVTVPVSVTFAVGTALTGTATDTANNTSEFGPNYVTTTMSALSPSRFNAFETSTAAGALTGPIQTRVAGVAGSLALIAIDNTGTALQTAFAGTVTLEWMNAADNSGALDAGNCRASWVAGGSAGSASFVSADQGRISTNLTPTAVGREWRLRISYAGPGGTVTSCATDPFAVRPATLALTGVTDGDATTAGTTRALDNLAASGGRVHHAGRPFSLRAAARDAASAVTAGYNGTPAIAITGCVLPAGCTAGALSAPALTASSGLIAADTLSYSEVGAINLQLTDDTFADIDAADTLLAQRRIQSAVVGVGRFVPDRYLLAITTTPQFATQQGACAVAGQGFTYVGQTFGWATTPSFTVTAQNAAGATTALWTGTLQKLTSAHIARSLAAANAQGLAPVVSWGSIGLTDTGAGTASVALSGDQVLFGRNAATPVASFNPLITLGIAVSDTSEVAVSGNSAIASTTALVIGAGTGIAFNQGSNFHYGRLKLQNAFGDARRGVRANVELQKFTARGWLRLSDDNTCLTVPVASVAFSGGSGAFATDVCTAPATAAVAMRQGRGTLVLPRTAGNVQGAAMLTLNIGPTLEGNACAAGVPVGPTSAAWPHLLGARGSGTTQDQNPAARLVWGRQHRDYMVSRELF